MTLGTIPFNRMTTVGREETYVAEAIASGRLAGGGNFSHRCEALLTERIGCRDALIVPSATAALELAARLLNLGPGDEVIMPSFTFVSTANAVCLTGARPRFVDIDPETLTMAPEAVEAAIGDRTRAIWPVHYAGIACAPAAIAEIAARHGLKVVGDAAQCIGALQDGVPVASLGDISAISFHETKNIGCGEGGALVLNSEAYVERAHVLREKGTNRRAFFEGLVDRYSWVDLGNSALISEISAAYLLGQLEQTDTVTETRRRLWYGYMERLGSLFDRGLLSPPSVPAGACHNGHIFFVTVADADTRHRLLDFLGAQGIRAVFHYVPLHSSPFGQRLGTSDLHLPVTDDRSSRLVRLPMFASLTDSQQDRVADGLFRFFGDALA